MTTINEISNHIMGYFNGTLDAFGYTAQSVNEISNPDESYMGTLNLQFRDYPIDDDEKVETYCRESDAFEQVVLDYINELLQKENSWYLSRYQVTLKNTQRDSQRKW